ncbi:MAG: hypothetical protein EOP88_04140 [Verrucomicrobiaceae bacterium]|nr:MAG: hypothetical protein EOP88_04140 [Verrucomicrobiaceae bacterium]
MKRTLPPDENARFSGPLRHYHRSGAQTQRSWDDWVEGSGGKRKGSRSFGKTLAVIVAALALLGIIAGLIVELR